MQDAVKRNLGTLSKHSTRGQDIHDTYDESVLFDSGESVSTPSSINACPRSISVGSKGSVRRYDGNEDSGDRAGIAWDGPIEQHTLTRKRGGTQVGEYYQDIMKQFSDGVRVHVVHTMQQGGREEHSWSTDGARCPVDADELEDIEESIRKVAESSNRVEGFLYMAEDTSVWGHVSKYLLEDSQEEYHGRSTYLFATRSATSVTHKNERRDILEGLSFSQLSQLVDLYVPMDDSLGHLKRVDSHSHVYQSSLSNAVGIFGVMIPFMKKHNALEMHRVASHLTGMHQCPLASLDMIFPTLRNTTVSFTNQIPRYDVDDNRISNMISYLGHDGVLQCRDDMIHRTLSSSFSQGLPVLEPISQLVPGIPPRDSEVPLISVLGSTKSFGGTLESLRNALTSNASQSLMDSWGVSREDMMESAEVLDTMADRLSSS